MVHFDLFSQKICTLCKFFVKKDGFFRPAGGGISYRVNNRVSRVINTSYAVTDQETDWAADRVADSRSLSQKNSHCEFFCDKDKKSTALPEAKRPSGLAPGRSQCHRVTRVNASRSTGDAVHTFAAMLPYGPIGQGAALRRQRIPVRIRVRQPVSRHSSSRESATVRRWRLEVQVLLARPLPHKHNWSCNCLVNRRLPVRIRREAPDDL
jgi:hypothetical protein